MSLLMTDFKDAPRWLARQELFDPYPAPPEPRWIIVAQAALLAFVVLYFGQAILEWNGYCRLRY